MKKLAIMLFLTLNTVNAQVAQDKKKHYTAGVFTSAVAYTYIHTKTKNKNKALVYSLASAILIGALKEAFDATQKGNKFDTQDLLATTLGGISFNVTIKLFNKKRRK
tara:strand:+ start:87 stop:407 length:321 start_codon:yes stop_codon:yes gene_type:complete